ncbi:MAG TPA: ribonucleoside-diphosphate reductase subunit alpha [Rhabdochlamydiaceae bacterium]|nr:ribonucleoside-diphosphate reductase subunit alpha [Rhabdochlamydiaceae bacterium]
MKKAPFSSENLAASALLKSPKELDETDGFTVVKRNGTLVPFRRKRIFQALEAAFRDTKKIPKSDSLPEEIAQTIDEMTDLVVKRLLSMASKGACLTVEGIQDLVEVTLMDQEQHDVARDYIIYRDQHKALREDSPQNLKIYRKDGSLVRFNPMKIASSVEKAFRLARNIEGPSPQDVIEAVNLLTQKVVARASFLSKSGAVLDVPFIQDEIENQLMGEGFFTVAKQLILYRAGFKEETPLQEKLQEPPKETTVAVPAQKKRTLTEKEIKERFRFACRGYQSLVSVDELVQNTILNFYDGITEAEVDLAIIMATRAKIEREPAYSKVASRLLLDLLYRETMGIPASDPKLKERHRKYFKDYLKKAISVERIHPALLEYDLDGLAEAMDLGRDDQFYLLGLQTLYDRYFIHEKQKRLETPQIFWMRVAMGLALNEKEQKNERAIEFYNVLSTFRFVSSTPTLFNSGTMTPQLSSCYLSTVMDDLKHIFKVISDDAQLSKWAGGLGNDWTNVRATGAMIKGTNGKSQGVIPFLKVANDTAVAVNQCFDPDTRIFTADGVKTIRNVGQGDLVLGISGRYRQVTKKFVYNQKDPMVAITIKHSIDPVRVTTAHPFYAIQDVPMEQANERTYNWLDKGKVRANWVDAEKLKAGDYIAQVIPKEVVKVPEFTEEDARLYGILLGDGHLTNEGSEWGVSGNPQVDEHLIFVREYLAKRNIHFWETGRGNTYLQIRWASGRGAIRNATTGCFVSAGEPTLPFDHEDLYDHEKCKYIAPRFAHLPKSQTLALLQGLLETDGNVSRGKEITFCNTSLHLVEGVRYQCLRLGIPTSGNRHKGETISYDLRIPATAELAEKIGCQSVTKKNWLETDGFIWSRVESVEHTPETVAVCDLEVEDDESYMTTSGLAHNGGKRKGALCIYLETWHLDIEDFLELRKNTGDERRRTHDINTANWIPDLFMKRVSENGHWTLFNPSDVPDLHDLYGKAFEERYVHYEKMVEKGEIKLFKKVEAVQLWRRMLSMLFETGHPWMTFKDPSNIRSPQNHVGVVHSSNLCTEILLNTSVDETAVCNLGSINIVEHMTENGLDEEKVAQTMRTAVRMLDNVIDINYYPTPEARNANLRHRPIGLGLMGFQDALYLMNISYASHEAVKFADVSMEMISYYAILASSELAKERGTYSSYKGSKWDKGYLPIDTLELLEKERGFLDVDRSMTMDWAPVRQSIKKYGMRNSNTMAIAPTATISNISGVTQSIEPTYRHLYVKSNLSGEFTNPNIYLVNKLKELGLWDEQMLDDLKYFDGVISEIERIPDEVKRIFLTAFEIDPEWIIECGSRRQKWIDMGESLNLYLSAPSGKKLHQMYLMAWNKGLKTTYYLRTLAATQIEKSTTDVNARGLQPRWMKNKSASSNIKVDREKLKEEDKTKKPLVCSMEEGCESCQ